MNLTLDKYWQNRAKTYDDGVQEEIDHGHKDDWANLFSSYLPEDLTGKKVLDLGCGPGLFSLLMAEQGASVTAFDKSEKMLEMAKKNLNAFEGKVTFVKGDCEEVSFENESFDYILSRNLTWMLSYPSTTYKLWKSYLKKEGKLIIVDAAWYSYVWCENYSKLAAKNLKEGINSGYDMRVSFKEADKCENLAKDMPMTYVKRPDFDLAILDKLGFESIEIKENIDPLVYDESFQIAYRSSPSFIIVCKKGDD